MDCYRVEFSRPGQCDVRPFALPAELAADELLVEAEMTLVSPGTEMAIFTGRHSALQRPNPTWPTFPFLPGYSMVGRVLRRGGGAGGVDVGQRVFASAPHATHAVVRAATVTPLCEDVPAAHAVFAELGAIALNGVRRSGIALGECVCVVGLGLVGLLATRLARLCGAMPLLAVDPSAARRELGAGQGADVIVDPTAGALASVIKGQSGGAGADVVIEASGVPGVVASSLSLVRNEGRVVLLGSPHGSVDVNFYDHVHRRGLHVVGAHMALSCHAPTTADPWTLQRNHRTFLDLVRRGDLSVGPLVSKVVAPAEVHAAYRTLAEAPGAMLGVVIDWSRAKGGRT